MIQNLFASPVLHLLIDSSTQSHVSQRAMLQIVHGGLEAASGVKIKSMGEHVGCAMSYCISLCAFSIHL